MDWHQCLQIGSASLPAKKLIRSGCGQNVRDAWERNSQVPRDSDVTDGNV